MKLWSSTSKESSSLKGSSDPIVHDGESSHSAVCSIDSVSNMDSTSESGISMISTIACVIMRGGDWIAHVSSLSELKFKVHANAKPYYD